MSLVCQSRTNERRTPASHAGPAAGGEGSGGGEQLSQLTAAHEQVEHLLRDGLRRHAHVEVLQGLREARVPVGQADGVPVGQRRDQGGTSTAGVLRRFPASSAAQFHIDVENQSVH